MLRGMKTRKGKTSTSAKRSRTVCTQSRATYRSAFLKTRSFLLRKRAASTTPHAGAQRPCGLCAGGLGDEILGQVPFPSFTIVSVN